MIFYGSTSALIHLAFLSPSENGLYNFVNDAFSASSSLLIFRPNTRTNEMNINAHTHVQEASKSTYGIGKNYNLICVTVSGVAWYPSKIASGIENARSINYLLGASKCVEHVLSWSFFLSIKGKKKISWTLLLKKQWKASIKKVFSVLKWKEIKKKAFYSFQLHF